VKKAIQSLFMLLDLALLAVALVLAYGLDAASDALLRRQDAMTAPAHHQQALLVRAPAAEGCGAALDLSKRIHG
jgi:hypothetical protein